MIRPGNSLLIDLHYKELGLEKLWDTRRVERLCSLMDSTTGELASMMMLSHTDMNKYLKAGKFPGPVCLLLTLIENFTVGGLVPDPLEGHVVFTRNGFPENT